MGRRAHLYVTNNGGDTVSQYNVAANGALRRWSRPPSRRVAIRRRSPSARTAGIGVTPNGRNLYVSNWNSGNLAEFGVNSFGSVTPMTKPTVPAGADPDFIAITPNGKHAP